MSRARMEKRKLKKLEERGRIPQSAVIEKKENVTKLNPTAERFIIRRYQELEVLNPSHPYLRYGHVSGDGHFYLKGSFYDEQGITQDVQTPVGMIYHRLLREAIEAIRRLKKEEEIVINPEALEAFVRRISDRKNMDDIGPCWR